MPPSYDDPRLATLNAKERAVYQALLRTSPATLAQLAPVFRRQADKPQANSWVRNSLRKLVALGLVVKVGVGAYSIAR